MAARPNRSASLRLAPALLLLAALAALATDGRQGVLEQAQDLRVEDAHAALALLDRHIPGSDAVQAPGGDKEQMRELARLLELRAQIRRDIGQREGAAQDAARLEEIAETLDEPVRQARAQFLRGTIQAERGDIAGALERFHDARRTLEPTGATAELARVTNALGVAHNFTDDYARAREYYAQALDLVRETDDAALESAILGNLAVVIGELDGVQAGLSVHREALALARERGDAGVVANQQANICSRLVEIGRLDEAVETCREALARVEALGNSRLIAGTLMSLGDLARARGRLEDARRQYESTLALAEDLVPSVEIAVLEKLAEVDEALGDPQLALDRMRQLMSLRAELLERERASLVEELEVRYRVEQQAREIELLELDRELQAADLRQRNLLLVAVAVALALVTLLLLVAWRGFTVKSRLERELAERNEELEQALTTITRLAREDALTGLLNRRGFTELAEREVRRSRRTDEPIALVMSDIDGFKQLNDRHGHAVGDEILRQIARRIDQSVRELDIVCRWGGEEFVFLLPRTHATEARRLVERVRDRVGATPFTTDAGTFSVSLTFGIAPLASDLDAAIESADKAMYRGKSGGGNRIVDDGDETTG